MRTFWGVAAGCLLVACLFVCARAGDPPRAAAVAAGERAAAPGARTGGPPSLGLNINEASFWSTEWTFVDLVKRAKPWLGKPDSFKTDQDGWVTWLAPNERVLAQVGDTTLNFPLGRYVALYKGKGQLSIQCTKCKEVSRAPGRIVVDVLDTTYVWIVLDAVDAKAPIRDIAVVPIEYEKTYKTQPFHPKFLELVRSFGAVRFMKTQHTNNNPQVLWSDRPRPTQAFQSSDVGVALELLVELANQSGADPWFCIPPRADDDYVRNFARLMWSGLDPKRTVYLEYGNEIWNEAYPYNLDGDWMTKRARALRVALNPSDDENDMTYRLRYQAVRSRQIFEIFQHEMDALRIPRGRLVRVLASQAVYTDRIRTTLDYRFPDGSFAYQHADAVAVAPYFGIDDQDLAEDHMTVDQIIDAMTCAVGGPGVRCDRKGDDLAAVIRNDHDVAAQRGLRLLGYEGGQHLLAFNQHPAFVEKLAAVNRSPRMKDLYQRYLQAWEDGGGDLMMLFVSVQTYDKSGYWGLLERQDQPPGSAPKLSGALDFMSTHPRWWPVATARPR